MVSSYNKEPHVSTKYPPHTHTCSNAKWYPIHGTPTEISKNVCLPQGQVLIPGHYG